MSKEIISKNNVVETDFSLILQQIRESKQKAYQQLNNILIDLYWNIGAHISHKVKSAGWGKSVIKNLAEFILNTDPEIKGFSDKNLWRMKQFYETYSENAELKQLTAKLSWSHNLAIFSRCKSVEEKEFYLKLSIKEKYTFRELERQIDASVYERTVIGNQKLSTVSRVFQDRIDGSFKDSYVLEFLNLSDRHTENHLQKALVANMKNFILELGKEFLFVGEEYRVQVGNSDFFIDLLFYHRGLSALVAFELKTVQFQPDHLGQLNFYLEALDRDVKKEHENPSIGILICKGKDSEVVEYALSRSLSPAMVADYSLKLPDKKLLQAKLHELLESCENE